MYPDDDFLLLGKVSKAHGLRGEVKVLAFSGQPENFKGYKELVLLESSEKLSPALVVEKTRIQGKTVIVKLASIESREQAEAIEGCGVLLAKTLLPATADNEYYWYQYQGKIVIDINGQTIGRVESLFNNGAQDILVINSGDDEILIPVTRNIIVEETATELIVDPPPGLLELSKEPEKLQRPNVPE